MTDTATQTDKAPYSDEDLEDLALSLSRNGPYFFGADVRSEESSMQVAKDLMDCLLSMGYDLPSLTNEAAAELDAVRDPEAGAKEAEKLLAEAEKASAPQKTTATVSSKPASS